MAYCWCWIFGVSAESYPQVFETEVVGGRAFVINYRDYQVTRGIRYIDENLIKGIKEEFFKRLQNTKIDPSRYNAFSPSATLRTAIAEKLGIFSEDNEYTFKLIRFPFQYKSVRYQLTSYFQGVQWLAWLILF